jgi:hypothetical protein
MKNSQMPAGEEYEDHGKYKIVVTSIAQAHREMYIHPTILGNEHASKIVPVCAEFIRYAPTNRERAGLWTRLSRQPSAGTCRILLDPRCPYQSASFPALGG